MVVRKADAGNYEVPGWGAPAATTPQPAPTQEWPDDAQIGKPAWTPSASTPDPNAEPGAGDAGAAGVAAEAPKETKTTKGTKGKAEAKAKSPAKPKAAKAAKEGTEKSPASETAEPAEAAKGHNVLNAELIAYVERLERLEEEEQAIKDDKKELYAEIKGRGYDTKILKIVQRRRKMDPDVRREMDDMVDTYEHALEGH